MIRNILVLMLTLVLTSAGRADPTVIKIEVPVKSAPPSRALKYTLLPGPDELTPGNAASRWRQAVQAYRESGLKITEQREERWLSPAETPLKDFPRKEVREFLDKAKAALRRADEAARRKTCDWEYPPLTYQNIPDLPFEEFSSMRQLPTLLSLRFRLQLAEGKIDDAVATLQTGLALGRHMGEGPNLVQSLVG